ncbi:DUF3800 domain-containing protein [Larkinella soli]|uniref:DUF3800 domain-containing protein n=1 Tax=Larkinella soli TaxID=1770527 RepID=UPI000FFC481D|nr:DUF3800 domain-containing protein [Larkinella soli]
MNSNERIYLDEAGNTGQDLLNRDQKVFVLASNNFSTNKCDEIVSLFKSTSELHFYNLKSSKAGREALINFLNHYLISEENIFNVVTNKEYSVVGQIVDLLIEHVMHKKGIDIYQHGYNITLTNFIYYAIKNFWTYDMVYYFLSDFIKMIRLKSKESIKKFFMTVLELDAVSKRNFFLKPILESQSYINDILEPVDKFSIDLTLPSFYVICDYWYKKMKNKLIIIQDDSHQMKHYNEIIDFTIGMDTEITEVGYGEKKMTFPTQIDKLQMADSKSNKGVQISDIIASSIAFVFNNKNQKQEKFVNEIKESKLFNLSNNHIIWPQAIFTPEELSLNLNYGENILDFLAQQKQKWAGRSK